METNKSYFIIAFAAILFLGIPIGIMLMDNSPNSRSNKSDKIQSNVSLNSNERTNNPELDGEGEQEYIEHTPTKEELDMAYTRDNIFKLLNVDADYDVDFFGGINNCKITLKNKTAYPLELVEVVVMYIRDTGELYDTKIVTFRNIPSNAELTLKAPNTAKGKSVELGISRITSAILQIDKQREFEHR